MANSSNIFHSLNTFILRLTGKFIRVRKVCFGIFLSLKSLVSVSNLLCVRPFITAAASNEQVRQTSARSGLGVADPA